MPNWNPLNNADKYGIINTLSSTIANIELIERDYLPNLRTDSELALISDYAGEHKNARFNILSYLLADRPGILSIWDHERMSIRRKFLGDGRRLAFKSLGDKNKQKALGPFLASASSINGVLFCVAIDKRIQSISYRGLPSSTDIAEWSSLSWSPKVFEKLVRVLHFGNFLVAGLCRPEQNLMWITDDDEIVANDTFHKDACRIYSRIRQHYCQDNLGKLTCGMAGKFNDNRRAEDLVSIVDVVGGAVSEILSSISPEDFPKSRKVVTPILKRLSTKSQVILSWLAEQKGSLKKIILVIRPSNAGKIQFSILNLLNLTGMAKGRFGLWLPPDKGWIQSIKSW